MNRDVRCQVCKKGIFLFRLHSFRNVSPDACDYFCLLFRKLLAATIRVQKAGQFIWVASDSWGAKSHPVRDQEWAAEGAITILPRRKSLTGFDDYFLSLRPRISDRACTHGNITWKNELKKNRQINCRNPWFVKFWEQHFKCRIPEVPGIKNISPNGTRRGTVSPLREKDLPECTGKEKFTNYEQEGLVPFVVDAVYAMAHAVHAMILQKCTRDSKPGLLHFCKRVKPAPSGRELLKYIREVNFTGLQGQGVRFNKDGDAYGHYFIYQYQNLGNRYDYVHIGNWSASLSINASQLIWKEENGSFPKSICSESCPDGYIRNFQDQCCWSCVLCREDSYVFNDTCVTCNPGYTPTQDRSTCAKLRPEHLTWGNPWALVPLVFSGLGVIATIFTAFVFLRFHDTPIIMASGRELCYVLLAGILFCFLMAPVILAKPTIATCGFLRLGLGLCLSICYSAIFTKTNRISRIFNGGIKGVKRPSYTSPRSQIVICFGLVTLQLIGTTVWLIIERPTTKEVYPYPLTSVLTCGISNLSLVMSLLYNMFLILLCTLYAFKTRKIPENFNEAKYIGFTMYSTCIIWLAFVPIYFGTNNDYKVQTTTMSMCVSLSAFVVLGCLFCPKLYIVLFQPYKNVRQGGVGCRAHANNSRNQIKFGQPSRSTSLFQPSTASGHSLSSVGETPSQEVNTISQGLKRANGDQMLPTSPVIKRAPSR
ncbi:hypothetical protein QYM36_012050 [Artemia franciscana]|uniref:G-protein coupled receptors family 3 profile domain-containing protein n=1 Tax=Artemia franciscana TaxID=6661 RepID=A0AA88KX58_ARTSF|nr:hypothetical protein QYM36_012050 [Artemia franciscana]